MKFSDDLYQLIRALTPSEKRYVKIIIKAFSAKGTKNQLALFDAFEQQKYFNEQKIRKKFAKIIPTETFHLSKNRLYKLILKALYFYHSKDSTPQEIEYNLFQANILLNKGLLKQACKLNQKGFKLATKNKYSDLILKTYNNDQKQSTESLDFSKIDFFEQKQLQQKLETLNLYKDELIQHYVEQQFFLFNAQYPYIRTSDLLEKIQALKKNFPRINNQLQNSPALLMLESYICKQEQNYVKALEYWEKSLSNFGKIQQLTKAEINNAIRKLNYFMCLNLEAGKYKEAQALREHFLTFLNHSFIQKNTYLQSKIKTKILVFDLKVYLIQEKYIEGIKFLKRSNPYIQQISENMNEFYLFSIQLYTSFMYVKAGHLKQAGTILNILLNNNNLKNYPHFFSQTIILDILIHVELNNTKLLQSLITSSYRILEKANLIYKTENLLLTFVKKYIETNSINQKIRLLQILQNSINNLKNDIFEQNFMPFFNIHTWIDKQIDTIK